MRNQSCLLCLLLAITVLFTAFPKSDAHAVDLTSGTEPIIEAGISSPTVLIAGNDLDVVPEAGLSVRAACNPNDPDHNCDASIADRCSAKKLKAAARYCQNAMHAQSTELRGSPRKAARKLSRARARFHRAWNSAQAAAAKAGESCSETGQDFGNVASGIDVAASSYADMASSNLDTAQRSGPLLRIRAHPPCRAALPGTASGRAEVLRRGNPERPRVDGPNNYREQGRTQIRKELVPPPASMRSHGNRRSVRKRRHEPR